MPPRNIASILNNESNLRILEKLKGRPYYPRELAGEMGVSEPFVVRRLKAMEEYDIVEGRWEAEGSRRVKRYYVKDVTLQLGKGGLQVTTSDAPVKKDIDVVKEALGTMTRLPLILVLLAGVVLNVWYLVTACGFAFAWYAAIDYAFYRDSRLKTPFLSMIVNLAIVLLLAAFLAATEATPVPPGAAAIAMSAGIIVLLLVIVYRSRFYQLEYAKLFEVMGRLMARLEKEPLHVRAFYLPIVVRWKVNEYFGLI